MKKNTLILLRIICFTVFLIGVAGITYDSIYLKESFTCNSLYIKCVISGFVLAYCDFLIRIV